ncbi:hypothetical protein JNUCC1_02612 [Lentibacillus sp. JNUCC-1]|uniref:DUF3231 family protein n=1 Tax=Lentibacillus sp. JNUCC-1 TaxID=2654513 RepID=UPI0012E8380B|nr:DUF3231 family protein [Lentibacillus sp. JNUCC-1]MUV38741.1 hypothetical protein [Lentibacillus sp. JNUCC-1]
MMQNPKLSSSELGSLWLTYQKKTMILRILEYFIEKADDETGKNLMSSLHEELHAKVVEIKTMLENEGAAIPEGFTEKDVNLQAPKLWDNGFDIMFCRVLKEISIGLYALHLTLSYRKDVISFYQDLSKLTETYFRYFTEYLLDHSLLSRPTLVNMPASTSFVSDKTYAKGTNILGQKRELSVVEFGPLYRSVETNITGMQLMEGFSKTTEDSDVKKHFLAGKALSKKQISAVSKVLLDNDIHPPATHGGTVTNSTVPPFSDKLMMFCNYLLSGLSMSGNGFGAGFSLRNDLQVKNAMFGKSIFQYQREGIHLMIAKGWLEEPPKMDL